jgi:mannose-6-phosphate isomerase-like protein (cupin superfamily)
MRYALAFWCLFFCYPLTATAQVLPTSSGSCGVGADGLHTCDWMSGVSRPNEATGKTTHLADDVQSELFVTRFILAPGAPLNPLIEGREVVIVGMNNGELLNEKKSPPTHVNVRNGLVMLMPKGEPYLLRNVGKTKLELLMIEVRK